jgi:hypothetical protein
MKFICDLSWDTKKILERIYKQSKHHQTRQREHLTFAISRNT